MQLNIKPQDRALPEKLELELHPALIQRLTDYAQSLDSSDVSYVVSQILDQVLPAGKGLKTGHASRAGKPKKDSSKDNGKKAA